MVHSEQGNMLWRQEELVEEGEAAEEHSGCCTEEMERGLPAPEAGVGLEAGWRIAPSGCGKVSPEAEVSGSA